MNRPSPPLKTYSHLDQSAMAVHSDVHDGIETTLVILHHALRGITVSRSYGAVPEVPIYVDELNQVWTNLIHNAIQALGGPGEIAIESRLDLHHGVSGHLRVVKKFTPDLNSHRPPTVARSAGKCTLAHMTAR